MSRAQGAWHWLNKQRLLPYKSEIFTFRRPLVKGSAPTTSEEGGIK